MRNYIPKTNNAYCLPHNLYMQMLYLIRDYPRMRQQYADILYEQPYADGQPRGNLAGDSTFGKAKRRLVLEAQLRAVDDAVALLHAKYADTCTGEPFAPYESFCDYGVFCYYRSRPGKDMAPSTRTWKRFRSEFAWHVAKNLHYF